MKRTVIGLLVLLSSSVARGEELRAALAREAGGKPVMLVADAAGLTALTPDRAFSRVLVAGAIKYAAHDPAKDLVWLLRGSTLEVVDLRAPTAVAVKIATGVAQESFEILGASSTTWSGDRNSETYLELTWGKKPSVALHSPVITDCDGGDIDRCERRQKAIDKKGARSPFRRPWRRATPAIGCAVPPIAGTRRTTSRCAGRPGRSAPPPCSWWWSAPTAPARSTIPRASCSPARPHPPCGAPKRPIRWTVTASSSMQAAPSTRYRRQSACRLPDAPTWAKAPRCSGSIPARDQLSIPYSLILE